MKNFLLSQFIHLITHTLGLRIREQDQAALSRRILARVHALGLSSPDAYYQLLSSELISSTVREAEWRELIGFLTITESYFFRDQGQFALLRNRLLPEIIQRKQARGAGTAKGTLLPDRSCLRVWSAGCSTGEEAYSLAILIRELVPHPENWEICILGTDVNHAALERAQRGIYGDWSFRAVDPNIQAKYFRRYREGWEIDPQLRDMVTFQMGNLVQDAYPSPASAIHDLDLILCRNVFIYFDAPAIAQVLNKFYKALAPYGYLMTGHTELHGQAIGQFHLTSFPASIVYQRVQQGTADSQAASAESARTMLSYPDRAAQATPAWRNGPGAVPVAQPLLKQPSEKLSTKLDTVLAPSRTASSRLASSIPSTASQPQTALPPLFATIEALISRKAYAQTIHTAQQFLALDPHHFKVHCLMAEAYANLGDYGNAEQVCQKAIQLDPLAVEPYYLLAQIAEEQGDSEAAKTWLKRVIYLAPASVCAYLELGALYEKSGNLSKAQTFWRSALNLLTPLAADEIVDTHRNLTVADVKTYLEKNLQSPT